MEIDLNVLRLYDFISVDLTEASRWAMLKDCGVRLKHDFRETERNYSILSEGIGLIQSVGLTERQTCTAHGFLDTSEGCQGIALATIVDRGAPVRSRSASDHDHAATAAARVAAGARWPSRSMSHSAL